MTLFPSKQQGVATLLVTVTIMLIVSIFMIFSNRSTFLEQKTATNQLKRSLAFDAAQSGLDLFVANLLDSNSGVAGLYMTGAAGAYTGVNTTYRNATSAINPLGYLNSSATATYHDFTNTNTTTLRTANAAQNFSGVTIAAPTGSNQVLSYSIYLVDLGAGRVKVFSRGCADEACPTTQIATSTAFAEAVVSVEVNVNGQSRCALEINNTLTVGNNSSINGFSPAGSCGVGIGNGEVQDGGNNGLGGKPAPPNFDVQSCPSTGSCPNTNNTATTPAAQGVVTNGVNSATDSYFTNYFGKNPTAIQGSSSTRTLTGNATGTQLCSELAQARSSNKTVLWITGNLTLTQTDNTSFGPSACPDTGYQAPGWKEAQNTTPPAPITVIVGGDLNINAALTFYGLLYVRGNMGSSAAGSIVVRGTAAFEGNVSTNASINVNNDQPWMDKFPFPPSSTTGSKVNATWRDF